MRVSAVAHGLACNDPGINNVSGFRPIHVQIIEPRLCANHVVNIWILNRSRD